MKVWLLATLKGEEMMVNPTKGSSSRTCAHLARRSNHADAAVGTHDRTGLEIMTEDEFSKLRNRSSTKTAIV